MDTSAKFSGGRNIAMKVPPHLWDETVRFYRDVIGLSVSKNVASSSTSICFDFGANRLWIDSVEALSQAELWLELNTSDIEGAARDFDSAGVVRRDEIEPLPEGFEGFWIQNPASIIHIVSKPDE